jgi:protein O-GlcNAc transferase
MSKRIRSKLSGKQAAQWERADRLVREGNTAEALPLLEKLASKAGYADAWVMLGVIAQRQRDASRAEHCYRQALAQRPDYPEVHSNIGQLLMERGAVDEAAEHFATTLEARPDFTPAHLGLGRIHLDAGRLEAAEQHLGQALEQRFDAATAGLLGIAKNRLGKTDEAEDLFRQWLRSGHDSYNANLNLGHLLLESGRHEEALGHYRRANSIRRDGVEALLGQAKALAAERRFPEAESALVDADRIDHGQVLNTFERETVGRRPVDEAPTPPSATALFFDRWLHQLRLCDWRNYEANLQTTRELLREISDPAGDIGLPPFGALLLPLDPATQTDLAKRRSSYLAQGISALGTTHQKATYDDNQRLRIGYLSPDFRRHAVTQMYLELLTDYDRERFEIYAYSLWPDDPCEVHQKIRRSCDHFIYLDKMSNREAAERVRADGIQILVDLAGHVKFSRPEILASRPAPVQAVYGGFPGSTGAPWIDYAFLSSSYLEPGDAQHYTEQLVLIRDTHQIVTRLPDPAGRPPQRGELGIPEDAFVFCSFQGARKLEPKLFSCWMRILGRVKGSILWLAIGDGETQTRLRGYAEQAGVDPDRLVFAPRANLPDHIQRHKAADLFLDTWTYGGITTVSAALWAGLPVLTWTGNNYTSRQGRAAMACYGLERETVATDLQDYEEKAVFLATHPQALQDLRNRIEDRRADSPLFQNEATIRRIERAYEIMWRKYLDGEAPAGFEVD